MNCSDVQNLIPLYCKGELDDELRRQVEEHLSGCPDCRTEKEREDTLGQVLGDGASQDPSDEYWGGYNNKVLSRVKCLFAIFWNQGCLPSCIAGLSSGVLLGTIAVWLSFGHGLDRINFVWLKWFFAVIGAIIGLIFAFLFKHIYTHGLPIYKKEEEYLKRSITQDPSCRALSSTVNILISLSMAVLVTVGFFFGLSKPLSLLLRCVLAIPVFFGFLAVYISTYERYVTGNASRNDNSIVFLILRILGWIAVTILILTSCWYLFVELIQHAP